MTPTSLENLIQQYDDDTPQNRELKELLAEIEVTCSLRFTYDLVHTRFPLLIAENILKKDGAMLDGKDVGIKFPELGYYAFYRHFGPILNYTLNTDFNNLLSFIDAVGKFLTSKGTRFGITELTKGLMQLLINLARTLEGSDIHGYATTLKLTKTRESPHQFLNLYLEFVPTSSISADTFWKVISHLLVEIGGPKPGVIDVLWKNFQDAVIQYCKNFPTQAEALKDLAISQADTPIVNELIPAVLTGNVEASNLQPKDLIDLLTNRAAAKFALIVLINNTPKEKYLKVGLIENLEEVEQFSNEAIAIIPWLLLSLLDKEEEEEELKKRYRNLFRKLLLEGSEPIDRICLSAMCRPTKNLEFLAQILKEKIESPSFNTQFFQAVDTFFCTHIDIEKFFYFLRFLGMRLGMGFSYKLLDNAIEVQEEENGAAFFQNLVAMLTDDEGRIRHAGHEILFNRSSFTQTPVLSFDPLTLDALTQYKFIISILIPIYQPYQTVPLVAPLFQSPYPVVVEVLSCKLEELIDSYKVDVIEAVDGVLNTTDPQRPIIMERLNAHLIELTNRLRAQMKIKELNPHVTNAALFRSFSSAFTKKSSKSMRAARKAHKGLISFATQVVVARGGGFVMPGHDKITPLQKISVSWTPPLVFFIEAERQDYYRLELFNHNWKEDFAPWEQIISS